jgi:aromatic ring hydroxylase
LAFADLAAPTIVGDNDELVQRLSQQRREVLSTGGRPALAERMTFYSPTSGERVGLSFIEPRTVDDLIRRRDMVKIWMDATYCMFGRSPDFMNILVTAFAGGRFRR